MHNGALNKLPKTATEREHANSDEGIETRGQTRKVNEARFEQSRLASDSPTA